MADVPVLHSLDFKMPAFQHCNMSAFLRWLGSFPVMAALGVVMGGLASARGDEATLPEAHTVLQRVLEHSQKAGENDRLFEQRYSFTRTETTEHRNGRGVLKKTESEETRHNAGQMAPADSKHPSGRAAGSTPKNRNGGDIAEADESAEIDEELLKHFQFTVMGREQIAGRPALKLVFAPAPGVQAGHSLAARVMSRISGEVWVDEAEYELVRVTFRLTGPVNVLAGIAGSLRAFTFQSERARTPDGLWFERQSAWHLEAREFLANQVMDGRQETSAVTPNPFPAEGGK